MMTPLIESKVKDLEAKVAKLVQNLFESEADVAAELNNTEVGKVEHRHIIEGDSYASRITKLSSIALVENSMKVDEPTEVDAEDKSTIEENNNGEEIRFVDDDINFEYESSKKVGEAVVKMKKFVVKKADVASVSETNYNAKEFGHEIAKEIHEESALKIDYDVKETVELKPFTYSQEGLVRLIKLDLGIFDEHEDVAVFDTVELRTRHNIETEERLDPPSKNIVLKKEKKEEMEGVGRAESEIEEYSCKVDDKKVDVDVREYSEEEKRKKVMGMSDIHLVSASVYHPD